MPASQPRLEDELLSRLDAAEHELEQLRCELFHHQRLAMLGTLAAGVAHETNNLLTPILAYAQLADRNRDDVDLLNALLDKCLIGLEPVTCVASTMLGLSSPSPDCADTDVQDAVARAIQCLGSRHPQCEFDIEVGLAARIAPVSMQQIVLNILLNACVALKRRRDGKIVVQGRQNGSKVIITIEDNGPGMSQQQQESLFKPFNVSRETSGNGLGLWVCQQLVERAGGTLMCQSEQGRGALFRLELQSVQSGKRTTSPGSTDR